MNGQDYSSQLLIVRKKLLDLHKEFLAHLKEEHDFKLGYLSSPTEWFQMITTQPEYEWLKEFNSLVTDVDVLTEIKPLPVEYAGTAKAELKRLLMGGPQDGYAAFTSRYLKILMSGSNILLYHHQIKTAIEALPDREISIEDARAERLQWQDLQRKQARQSRN